MSNISLADSLSWMMDALLSTRIIPSRILVNKSCDTSSTPIDRKLYLFTALKMNNDCIAVPTVERFKKK